MIKSVRPRFTEYHKYPLSSTQHREKTVLDFCSALAIQPASPNVDLCVNSQWTKVWVQLNHLHRETKSIQNTPLTPGATENSMFYYGAPEITSEHTTESEPSSKCKRLTVSNKLSLKTNLLTSIASWLEALFKTLLCEFPQSNSPLKANNNTFTCKTNI